MIYHIHQSTILHPTALGELRMYQLGRAYCDTDSVINDHFHGDFFELTLVSDGAGTVFAENVPSEVKKGDIYLSMPYESHRIVSDSKSPLKYDFFAFNTDNTALKTELELLRECRRDPQNRVFSSEKLASVISSAVAEMNGGALYSGELLEHLLNQVPIYLIRALSSKPHNSSDAPHTKAQVLCCRMMNYIDTNICTIKSLEDLSAVFGYSYKYLSSLFRHTTSMTLASYYKNKKLDLAAKSVTDGKLKFGEIAELLGYSSVYSFSKAFSEHFGMSPRAFREASVNRGKEIDQGKERKQ